MTRTEIMLVITITAVAVAAGREAGALRACDRRIADEETHHRLLIHDPEATAEAEATAEIVAGECLDPSHQPSLLARRDSARSHDRELAALRFARTMNAQ